jgi:peptide/nickel transport system permease protein
MVAFDALNTRRRPRLPRSLTAGSRNRPAILGAVILVGLVVVFVLPGWLPDPLAQNIDVRLQGPSGAHWFGTDGLGRDVFTRVISGARVSLTIAACASFFAMTVGSLYGAAAAIVGGVTETVMLRVLEIFLAFPGPLLALVLAVAIGPGMKTLIIAISIVFAAPVARLIRGLVLDELKQDYVSAAVNIGSSRARIFFRHILLSILAPALVYGVIVAADAVLVEAGLSYLGAGVSPPTAAWGSMIQEGQTLAFGGTWWVVLFPGLALGAVVLALNTLADSIVEDLRIGGRRG